MRTFSEFRTILKPALIIYAVRSVASALIILPMFVFITGKFGNSLLADKFWPLPHGLAFLELIWQMRELLFFIIPLLFIIIIMVFFITQFIYGGIYEYLWRNGKLEAGEFFRSCGRRFGGYVKIALVGIPWYIVVILAADLVALLFAKLASAIAGLGAARFITYLILFLSLYLVSGYLISMRYLQLRDNNSSIRYALREARVIFAGKMRYFVALNILAGAFTFLSFSISLWLIALPYGLSYSPAATILTILVQQAFIFWISLMEIFQIKINGRFAGEIDYGT
jgi:hypothetical protein